MASDGGQGSPEQYQAEMDAQHQMMQEQDVANLQQQDDAEYDGEIMPAGGHAQVSNALAEQRASKKRAADDVKLLANRIALLKLEEKKVSVPFRVLFHRLLALNCTGVEKNRRDQEEG